MNPQAVIHQSRGLDCFPTGANSFCIRLRTAKGDFDGVQICFALNKYAWWQHRETKPLAKHLSDSLYDYYQAELRGRDTRLAYIFILTRGDKTYYFSEEGLAETYDFEKAYLTHFQYPYIHLCDVHRVVSWADSAVFYQIFPERFDNGLGGKAYVNAAWGDTPAPTSFFGGDLPGVKNRLGYIRALGVNCLYLTPVFPSPSNHKYDILDYRDVDAGFGGKEALRQLIDAAHSLDIRVVLDGVFNHCSVKHPFFQDAVKNGPLSPYWDWFFIDGDEIDLETPNYLTFGAVNYMPKLNTGNPEVIRYFCDTGAWWVREFGIDGWRLDVMDEISIRFLRAFRDAVKGEFPDAVILGELWHEPESYLRGDQLDGVMNYGLTKACMDYLASGTIDAKGMRDRLCMLLARCTAPASRMMLNLLDCHDTHRFLTLLKGDKARMKLALCILFFFVGMPCVYYGDEIGLEGGYDPDCRRTFPWDESQWDQELLSHTKMLCAYRASGALSGADIDIGVSGRVLVITRSGLRLLVNATGRRAVYSYQNAKGALPPFGFRIEPNNNEE